MGISDAGGYIPGSPRPIELALSHPQHSIVQFRPTYPVLACLLFVLSDLAVGADLTALHTLTLTELTAQAEASPSSIDLKLATAKKIGQTDQGRAQTILDELTGRVMTPGQALYRSYLYCEINIRRGDLTQAAPHCDSLPPSVARGVGSANVRALALKALAYRYLRQGRPEEALSQLNAALQLEGLDDPVVIVTLLHNRGVALMTSGLTDLAIDAFEKADAGKAVLPADESLPTLLAYNLGYVQAQAGRHEEALKSYESVLPWLRETKQTARIYIALTQVALSLNGLGRYQDALDELLPMLQDPTVSVSANSAAHAQQALAQAYLGLDQPEAAQAALLKGIDIALSNDNPTRLRDLSISYAAMLLDRGNANAAISTLNKLINEFEASDTNAGLAPAHQLLAKAYSALGEFKVALNHRDIAAELRQASQSEDFARRLATLRVNNELDLKNQQLALALERERSALASQRLSTVVQAGVIGSLLVMLLLVYLLLSRSANLREAKAHKQAAEQLKIEVEARTREVEQALEQRYASDRLKAKLEVRLAKDDKLRLIGQLTGGVAHDFNNIMTVVQLSAELLLNELKPTQRKLVEDILTATGSGQAVTRGLLAYARQQVLQPSTIYLRDFVEANQSIFRRTVDESIEFETRIEDQDGPLVIWADAGQLTSSILNLLLNAREASPAGGRIVLSVVQRAAQVHIEVRDSGRGMTPQQLSKATEPFFTTKAMSEGSGIGLSMVEGFMQQSGGQLTIDSRPGAGTVVQLKFQAADPAVAAPANVTVLSRSTGRRKRILLVEDEAQIREVCSLVLEEAGYKVVTAGTGEEALAKFRRSKRVDLVVSDLVMPGNLAGDQLIAEIHRTNPELPALLMSGYAATAPGHYPLLTKPFRGAELLAKVREVAEAG